MADLSSRARTRLPRYNIHWLRHWLDKRRRSYCWTCRTTYLSDEVRPFVQDELHHLYWSGGRNYLGHRFHVGNRAAKRICSADAVDYGSTRWRTRRRECRERMRWLKGEHLGLYSVLHTTGRMCQRSPLTWNAFPKVLTTVPILCRDPQSKLWVPCSRTIL